MWDEPLAHRCQDGVALLDRLPENRRVFLLCDADVDGTSAAAALALTLHRLGRRFHVRLSRRRDAAYFDEVIAAQPDLLITADLGAAEVERFARARLPTIVLDHHVPGGDGDGAVVVHVNPHLEGEDGSATASGAAVAVAFATTLLESKGLDAAALLPFAFLGAAGDRYHGARADAGLHGRLRRLVREGKAGGTLVLRDGPSLPDLPLREALAASLDPFVARAAGRPEAAAKLLEPLGIDATRSVGALSEPERRALASWLALELLEQGAAPGMVEAVIAPNLQVTDAAAVPAALRGHSIDDAAALMDAAVRSGQAESALAALLGHPGAWQELRALAAAYRERVRAPLASAARGRLVPLGPAGLVRLEDGRFTGPVADRIMAWTKAGARPVVAVGPGGSRLKVSMRARAGAVRWALDEVAAEAKRLGGAGGGHALAAGATLDEEKEAQFLEAVGKRLGAVAGTARAEAVA